MSSVDIPIAVMTYHKNRTAKTTRRGHIWFNWTVALRVSGPPPVNTKSDANESAT
jgi:hypothetical protein